MLNLKKVTPILIIPASLTLLVILLMTGETARETPALFTPEGLLPALGEVLLFILLTFFALFFIAVILFLMFSGIIDIDPRNKKFAHQPFWLRTIPLLFLAVLAISGLINLGLSLGGENVMEQLRHMMDGAMSEQDFETGEEQGPPAWLFPYLGFLGFLVTASFATAVIFKVRDILLMRKARQQFTENDPADEEQVPPYPFNHAGGEKVLDFKEIYARVSLKAPRPAVLTAYLAMLYLVKEAGIHFPESSTPEEKLDMIEDELRLAYDNPAASLTGLYLKARYSRHRITERDKEEALNWLGEIADLVSPFSQEEVP